MFKTKKIQFLLNNQSGVVLIVSLMILLVMIVSVIALSRIISGEVKMTRNFDNAIVSYYLAESGMEEALFYLKYSKETGDFNNYFNQLDDSQSAKFLDYDKEKSYIFSLATTTVDYFEAFNLSTTSPAKIDIIDLDGEIPSAASMLPTAYDLEWSINDCYSGGHASDKLEISYTSLYKSGITLKSETKQTFINCGCSSGSDSCDLFTSSDLANNKFFYFTLKPLNDDVAYIKLTPKLGSGQSYLPGFAKIQVSGLFRQSIYYMTAELPVYAPLSNVFNYVVFSEEGIEK